jgi:large subunit ribosomal protein L17
VAHGIDGRKLGRKQGHRLALYANLIVSVLRYERIRTTEAKAKEVRPQVEHIITLAKRGTLADRRQIVASLPDEPLVVDKLFRELAPKYADRTSGYTRIIRIGERPGDRALMVQLELV